MPAAAQRKYLQMLATDRTDKLDEVRSKESAASAGPRATVAVSQLPTARRCRYLSEESTGTTPADCCGSPAISVHYCQMLDRTCVPHQIKRPRDESIVVCRTCRHHVW